MNTLKNSVLFNYDSTTGNIDMRCYSVDNEKKITDEKTFNQISLFEIGPRMTLSLVKILEGLNTGEVIYHAFENKTEEEIMELNKKKEKEKIEKNKRKLVQANNVERK